MQVIDYEKCETGPQRRRTNDGHLLHCCCICGTVATWRKGWSRLCSVKDEDDHIPIPKFCSDSCRSKGGPSARNVTYQMKLDAQAAEWREPRIVYREATAIQKYMAAVERQNGRASGKE